MRKKKKSLHVTFKTDDGREKLIYLRKGKMNDMKTKGVVYRHEWPTGYQELIFPDHKAAATYFKEKSKLQSILEENDFAHIIVIDKDRVLALVDEEWTIFTSKDKYGGHPLSGLASFGTTQGDHRMISEIAEDIQRVFKLLNDGTTEGVQTQEKSEAEH